MCYGCQLIESVPADYLDELIERNNMFSDWYNEFEEGLDDKHRDDGELYDMLHEAFQAGVKAGKNSK